MQAILPYLRLPAEMTDFESYYVRGMNRIALVAFACHLPLFVAVAWFNGTGPLLAAILTGAVLVVPLLAQQVLDNPRHVSMVHGFTAMLMGALLVHFGQGPVQIEMHFYFFSVLAVLAMFANPAVILTAAATVTVHHLTFWWFLPASVFNYDASFWVVGVHASFVVVESVAACFISRSFFDNVIGLEKLVQDRTAELDARNESMRLVLDNVEQGFLTLTLDGRAGRERSAAAEHLLGPAPASGSFAAWLTAIDPKVGGWFELGFEMLDGGLMPVDVSLAQLPSRLKREGRDLSLSYSPIEDDSGELVSVMVVVTDITAQLKAARAEAEQRETMNLFRRVMDDKAGFLEFLADSGEIVGALQERRWGSLGVCKRWLHTVKGNAMLFGIKSVSTICHELEDVIVEEKVAPTHGQLGRLVDAWDALLANVGRLIGDEDRHVIELADDEYRAILEAVLAGRPREELAVMIQNWRLEPTAVRLERITEQARGVADWLGKGHVQFTQSADDLRLDPEKWAGFWGAFVHVVRNALDHGIGSPEAHEASGEPAEVRFTTRMEGDEFVIEVADNGQGVDWAALRTKAETLGMPASSREELKQVIFADGVSTKAQATEFSGRGVGMGAVRAATEELDGRVDILSETGAGTTVRFRFPKAAMHDPAQKAA